MPSHVQGSAQLLPTTIIPSEYAMIPPAPKLVFLDGSPAKKEYANPLSLNGHIGHTTLEGNFFKPKVFNEDVVYENIRPVLSMLRVMGSLPIRRSPAGVSIFKLASSAMFYSVAILTSLVTYVLYQSLHKLQINRSTEGRFEEAVIEYLFTVYLFPLMMVPLLWLDTPKIGKLLNSWKDFEVAYKKLSGRALPMGMSQRSLAIAVVIPIVSTTTVVVTHVTMVHFQVAQLLPYIFLEILTYMLGGYWYLLCRMLSVCANTLAEDFHQVLRQAGWAGRVAEYRHLWLRLSQLARDTGTAHCCSFTYVTVYLFLIITLSVYGLLSQISVGFGTKDIGLAFTASCSILLLFFICDGAHHASHNVRTNFQKKLLMVELSWMSREAHTEVNLLLRATEMNDSRISLSGFFHVDRILFKSLLATMVTYLVVLLQFQISIPDSTALIPNCPAESANETTTPYEPTATTITTILTTVLARKKKKH